ncbi:hypothetical protein V6N13_088321 [Hibiscus sabdariffa]
MKPGKFIVVESLNVHVVPEIENVDAGEGYHDYGQIQKLAAKMRGFGRCVSVQNPFTNFEDVVYPYLSIPLEILRSDPMVMFWKGSDVGGAQTFVFSRVSKEGRSMGLVEATLDEECEMVQGDTLCPS